jgi:hypothetical protein
MLSFLKTHPFNVTAFFESSTVLTFAIPKEELMNKIPANLELDVYDDKWAFVAVAMVQTKKLKPEKAPKLLEKNFFLIGYRIFVKYRNPKGKIYRGLYVIKSETDKKLMTFLGNTFTHYNYSKIDINVAEKNNITTVNSTKTGLLVKTEEQEGVSLPQTSPFKDWKTARKFAGPLPFSFSFNGTKEMIIIEGVRQNWKPTPIEVLEYNIPFLKELNIKNPVLANAFTIKNIPYKWKKGQIIKL